MGRRSRIKGLMWLLALGYPAVMLLMVLIMTRAGTAQFLGPFFLLSVVLLLPPVLMLVAFWIGTRRGAPTWGWTLVLILWISCVGYVTYLFAGHLSG